MGKLFYLKAARDRMAFYLLIFGCMLSMTVAAGVDLQCTNDRVRMFCQLGLENCLEYNLTLRSDSGHGEENCILRQCTEQCCCDVEMDLIFGESHTATVWKGNTTLESKTIRVIESLKPRTPTITSVIKTDNNFGVSWWTNMEEFENIYLKTQMTYYKKGEPKVWKNIQPSIPDGQKQQYFEINGQHLDSSTTYLVKVRSVAVINNAVSNSSEEWEFHTPASNNPMFFGIITALSVAVIIITIAMYRSYVKLKTNWWDKLPNPKIPIMQPVKKMMLEPEKFLPTRVSVEQPKTDDCKPSSEMSCTSSQYNGSTCSSADSWSSPDSYADAPVDITPVTYALSKLFPNIVNPVLPPQTSVLTSTVTEPSAILSPHTSRYDGSTSGSSAIVNASYSLLIPESSNVLGETPDVQLDLNFPNQSGKIDSINIYAQDVSPLMPTGMCQPCSTDPQRFPRSGDTSSSSISSGIGTASSGKLSRPASSFSSFSDSNRFHACLLPGSHSSVVLEDDYKPIQSVVAQPDVGFSDERRSRDQGEDLDQEYQEKPFSKMPQSCLNQFPGVSSDALRGLSQLKFQTPFLFLMPSNNCVPITTESDYHCV